MKIRITRRTQVIAYPGMSIDGVDPRVANQMVARRVGELIDEPTETPAPSPPPENETTTDGPEPPESMSMEPPTPRRRGRPPKNK